MSVVPRGYADVSDDEPIAPRRRRRAAVAQGAHRVLVALAVVGSLHALFVLGVESWRFVSERRAVTRLENQVGDLQNEAKGLQQVIGHANDMRYREDLARRQGFMYPNELRAVTQQPPPSTTSRP